MQVNGSYTASLWALQKALAQPAQLLGRLKGGLSGTSSLPSTVAQSMQAVSSSPVASSSGNAQSSKGQMVDITA